MTFAPECCGDNGWGSRRGLDRRPVRHLFALPAGAGRGRQRGKLTQVRPHQERSCQLITLACGTIRYRGGSSTFPELCHLKRSKQALPCPSTTRKTSPLSTQLHRLIHSLLTNAPWKCRFLSSASSAASTRTNGAKWATSRRRPGLPRPHPLLISPSSRTSPMQRYVCSNRIITRRGKRTEVWEDRHADTV